MVLDALRRLRRGLTTVMISHRIATVRDADRILVLSDGRIVEQGTHGQLLEGQGLYSQLNQIQSSQDSRSV
jgi:ATP-binding cassette subfamily B protein